MTTKYYADKNGKYLGGFDGTEAPEAGIEVPFPPQHGTDKWDGAQWNRTAERPADVEQFITGLAEDPTVSPALWLVACKIAKCSTIAKMREVYAAHGADLTRLDKDKMEYAALTANLALVQ